MEGSFFLFGPSHTSGELCVSSFINCFKILAFKTLAPSEFPLTFHEVWMDIWSCSLISPKNKLTFCTRKKTSNTGQPITKPWKKIICQWMFLAYLLLSLKACPLIFLMGCWGEGWADRIVRVINIISHPLSSPMNPLLLCRNRGDHMETVICKEHATLSVVITTITAIFVIVKRYHIM